MIFFGLEGPFMRFFDKVFNLLWLNIIVMVCCIPVFTAGAAFTAMHYVILRILKNEEGYVLADFKKSFKANFKQATKIWLVCLVVVGGLVADVYFFAKGTLNFPAFYKFGIYLLLFAAYMGLVYIFPVLSHYENTIRGTVKNAFAMAASSPPRTLLMMALYAAPWIAAVFVPNFVLICPFFAFTLPAYLSATLYEGVFTKFEREEAKAKVKEK